MLEGRSYRLQYPWIGVVNRSQADINKNGKLYAIVEICRIFDQIYKEHLDGVYVHAIMKDLVHKAINETPELKQYPTLRVEVANAAFESLERMREESRKSTLKLVDMECSYLTVDFFRKLPQDIEKGGNPAHSIFDRYNDSYLRRIGELF
ncbi:hypothetical protein BHM03_00019347 [Ensete ventricosum]|nr:hypothetical protein BHM03_00019347 [Ensete ventricosum]